MLKMPVRQLVLLSRMRKTRPAALRKRLNRQLPRGIKQLLVKSKPSEGWGS